MRFKEFLKESIIDVPRKNYAVIFDNADTDSPKLKEKVRQQVLDGIKQFEKFGKIVKYGMIGSILTKQYRKDADLDINILFDLPGSKEEQEVLHKKIREFQGTVNGEKIPGTEHVINYFSIIDPATYSKANEMADGVFDLNKNTFIKKPKPLKFEPETYVADFQRKVAEIDVVKGELVRDMIDYEELKELNPKDIEGLNKLVSDKLDEIKSAINTLIDIGDKTTQERKDAFVKDMSPDEIRKFGVKNKLPKNVIYKMLEKYHYLTFFKHLKDIMADGKITPAELKSLSKIKEAKGRHIAFTFGRFNPPTIGHEKLLDRLSSVRADEYYVFLSRSEDSDKNPLSYRNKVAIMKKMFPRYARNIVVSPSNRVFDIVVDLYNKGASEVTMVVGSDRVREFDTLLKQYNDIKSRHGYYNFDNINIVSAGERDPDAEGATGMSASKMRDAAAKGDLKSFQKGLPSGVDADALMKDVRKGMKLAASVNHTLGYDNKPIASLQEFEQQQIRDLYVRDMIFGINEEVHYVKEDIKGKVVRRSTNYIVVEDKKNNLHKAWIWDCVPLASDREVELREHNLNVDYGFEAVSEPPKRIKSFKESYDIGHDYAQHTAKMTPGQHLYDKNYQGGNYKPSEPEGNKKVVQPTKLMSPDIEKEVTHKDVKEWASSESVIDKYKQRYKTEWKARLDEVVAKMMERL